MSTYSYSGDPALSDLDWVRFTIRDTATPWHFSNEEILAIIAEKGKIGAAIQLAEQWAVDLGRQASFTLGSFSEQYQQAAEALQGIADSLKNTAAPGAFCAGQVNAAFTRGMHRNPRTSGA